MINPCTRQLCQSELCVIQLRNKRGRKHKLREMVSDYWTFIIP
jgi:hypothetical protein